MLKGTKVVTKKFKAGFVNVFQPNEDDKYGVTMIFDNKSDLKNLKENVDEFIAENKLDAKKLEMPWKSGDMKADKDEAYEDLRGKWLVNTKTKFKLNDKVVGPDNEPIIDSNEFYSGCYARAVVTPYKWTYKKREGISFNVVALQKVSDGERYGGSTNPSDYFEKVETVDVDADFDI